MLGRFFRWGKIRHGFFFPRGEIYTGILYPGAILSRGGFSGGKFYAGGGDSMLQHRHWPAASIARVSCSSLFPPSDVLPFCVRNWGTTIWFWGGGGVGWHFVEINILTLKMLKINNLSSSVKKTNNLTLTFLQFNLGGGGGVANFSHILLLASLATS